MVLCHKGVCEGSTNISVIMSHAYQEVKTSLAQSWGSKDNGISLTWVRPLFARHLEKVLTRWYRCRVCPLGARKVVILFDLHVAAAP